MHLFSPILIMRKILYSVMALLVLATSCGEIELPQPDQGPGTQQPGKADGDKGSSDAGGSSDTGGSSDSSGSSDAEGKGDSGDSDVPATDLRIGTATFTAGGHLLIADRLYLSLEEYSNVSSAYGSMPTQAAELAAAYAEGELTGWRVPTEADVTTLRDALACASPSYVEEGTETLPPLNKELERRGYYGLYREWYIFGDGNSVFGFTFDETTKKASKNQTYRLRLVRDKD